MSKIENHTVYPFTDGRMAKTTKIGTKYVEFVVRHGKRGRFGTVTYRLPKDQFKDQVAA